MKESKLQLVLSYIHLVFVLSLVFFGTTYLTGSILFIPGLCAAFAIGKDLLEGKFNVYDGLIKRFFHELKRFGKSLRFFPVQVIIALQFAGIIVSKSMQNFYLQVIMLVIAALLLTYLSYACAYLVFKDEKMKAEEVLILMFQHVGMVISLFILMLLLLVFFRLQMLAVALAAGALVVLVVEAAIYYTIKKGEE